MLSITVERWEFNRIFVSKALVFLILKLNGTEFDSGSA